MQRESTSELCTIFWPYLNEDDPTILLPRGSFIPHQVHGGEEGGPPARGRKESGTGKADIRVPHHGSPTTRTRTTSLRSSSPRTARRLPLSTSSPPMRGSSNTRDVPYSTATDVMGGQWGYAWIVGWTLTGLNVVIATFLKDMTLAEAIHKVATLRRLGDEYYTSLVCPTISDGRDLRRVSGAMGAGPSSMASGGGVGGGRSGTTSPPPPSSPTGSGIHTDRRAPYSGRGSESPSIATPATSSSCTAAGPVPTAGAASSSFWSSASQRERWNTGRREHPLGDPMTAPPRPCDSTRRTTPFSEEEDMSFAGVEYVSSPPFLLSHLTEHTTRHLHLLSSLQVLGVLYTSSFNPAAIAAAAAAATTTETGEVVRLFPHVESFSSSYRLRTHQQDIWLELRYQPHQYGTPATGGLPRVPRPFAGLATPPSAPPPPSPFSPFPSYPIWPYPATAGPCVLAVLCAGYRLPWCQLHVFRCDQRQWLSQKIVPQTPNALYSHHHSGDGNDPLAQPMETLRRLQQGERPLPIPGATSVMEGVLLPLPMRLEAGPKRLVDSTATSSVFPFSFSEYRYQRRATGNTRRGSLPAGRTQAGKGPRGERGRAGAYGGVSSSLVGHGGFVAAPTPSTPLAASASMGRSPLATSTQRWAATPSTQLLQRIALGSSWTSRTGGGGGTATHTMAAAAATLMQLTSSGGGHVPSHHVHGRNTLTTATETALKAAERRRIKRREHKIRRNEREDKRRRELEEIRAIKAELQEWKVQRSPRKTSEEEEEEEEGESEEEIEDDPPCGWEGKRKDVSSGTPRILPGCTSSSSSSTASSFLSQEARRKKKRRQQGYPRTKPMRPTLESDYPPSSLSLPSSAHQSEVKLPTELLETERTSTPACGSRDSCRPNARRKKKAHRRGELENAYAAHVTPEWKTREIKDEHVSLTPAKGGASNEKTKKSEGKSHRQHKAPREEVDSSASSTFAVSSSASEAESGKGIAHTSTVQPFHTDPSTMASPSATTDSHSLSLSVQDLHPPVLGPPPPSSSLMRGEGMQHAGAFSEKKGPRAGDKKRRQPKVKPSSSSSRSSLSYSSSVLPTSVASVVSSASSSASQLSGSFDSVLDVPEEMPKEWVRQSFPSSSSSLGHLNTTSVSSPLPTITAMGPRRHSDSPSHSGHDSRSFPMASTTHDRHGCRGQEDTDCAEPSMETETAPMFSRTSTRQGSAVVGSHHSREEEEMAVRHGRQWEATEGTEGHRSPSKQQHTSGLTDPLVLPAASTPLATKGRGDGGEEGEGRPIYPSSTSLPSSSFSPRTHGITSRRILSSTPLRQGLPFSPRSSTSIFSSSSGTREWSSLSHPLSSSLYHDALFGVNMLTHAMAHRRSFQEECRWLPPVSEEEDGGVYPVSCPFHFPFSSPVSPFTASMVLRRGTGGWMPPSLSSSPTIPFPLRHSRLGGGTEGHGGLSSAAAAKPSSEEKARPSPSTGGGEVVWGCLPPPRLVFPISSDASEFSAMLLLSHVGATVATLLHFCDEGLPYDPEHLQEEEALKWGKEESEANGEEHAALSRCSTTAEAAHRTREKEGGEFCMEVRATAKRKRRLSSFSPPTIASTTFGIPFETCSTMRKRRKSGEEGRDTPTAADPREQEKKEKTGWECKEKRMEDDEGGTGRRGRAAQIVYGTRSNFSFLRILEWLYTLMWWWRRFCFQLLRVLVKLRSFSYLFQLFELRVREHLHFLSLTNGDVEFLLNVLYQPTALKDAEGRNAVDWKREHEHSEGQKKKTKPHVDKVSSYSSQGNVPEVFMKGSTSNASDNGMAGVAGVERNEMSSGSACSSFLPDVLHPLVVRYHSLSPDGVEGWSPHTFTPPVCGLHPVLPHQRPTPSCIYYYSHYYYHHFASLSPLSPPSRSNRQDSVVDARDYGDDQRHSTRSAPPPPPTSPFAALVPSSSTSPPSLSFLDQLCCLFLVSFPLHDVCRCHYVCRMMVDWILGVGLYLLLAVGGPPMFASMVQLSQFFLVGLHIHYLQWFEGWPAGLKLNEDLCMTLGFIAQTTMELWDSVMRWSPFPTPTALPAVLHSSQLSSVTQFSPTSVFPSPSSSVRSFTTTPHHPSAGSSTFFTNATSSSYTSAAFASTTQMESSSFLHALSLSFGEGLEGASSPPASTIFLSHFFQSSDHGAIIRAFSSLMTTGLGFLTSSSSPPLPDSCPATGMKDYVCISSDYLHHSVAMESNGFHSMGTARDASMGATLPSWWPAMNFSEGGEAARNEVSRWKALHLPNDTATMDTIWCIPTKMSDYSWVVGGYQMLLLFCLLGASCGLAWIADITVYVTLHIRLLHHGTAGLFYWAQLALRSLRAQFRGMRFNPLRQRTAPYEFQADQLLAAVLLFAVLVFLMPTISVYYFYFSFIRISVWIVQEGLAALAYALMYLPIYPVGLRLWRWWHQHDVVLPGCRWTSMVSSYVSSFFSSLLATMKWCGRWVLCPSSSSSFSNVASKKDGGSGARGSIEQSPSHGVRYCEVLEASTSSTNGNIGNGGGIHISHPVHTQPRTVELTITPLPLPASASLAVDFKVVCSLLISPFTSRKILSRILNGEVNVSLDHLSTLIPHLLGHPEAPACVLPQKPKKSG